MGNSTFTIRYVVRVFVPAGVQFDALALAGLVPSACIQRVDEGEPPVPFPSDAVGLCQDMLLDDGSASTHAWWQQLINQQQLSPLCVLLRSADTAPFVAQGAVMPQLVCQPDNPASWAHLVRLLFEAPFGLMPLYVPDLVEVLSHGYGRLQLATFEAHNAATVQRAVCDALSVTAGREESACLLVVCAASMGDGLVVLEAVEPLLDTDVPLAFQCIGQAEELQVVVHLLLGR